MFSSHARVAIATFCLLLVAGRLHAQEAARLTLGEAITRAVRQHPDLRGFEFRLRDGEAHAAEAALKPMPQLELQLEDFAGQDPHGGFSGAQSTLSVGQVLELGGKREARLDVAAAALAGIHTEQAARQIDVVAEVARRFFDVLEGQFHEAMAGEAVRTAEQSLQRVDQRVAAARSPPAERSRAFTQLVEAQLLREDVGHELEAARFRLATAMGEHRVRFGRAEGDLLALSPPVPFEELVARLDASPDLLRFADEARLRDAELRLAEVRRRPDLRLNLGVRRYEQTDDYALVAGVAMPLFGSRQALPREQQARAQRDLVDLELASHRLDVEARVHSLYLELEHARHLTDTLRTELIPALEKALAESTYAWERGRYSHLEWSLAQRDLLAARMRVVTAAASFHVLRTEIERLTADDISASGVLP
jgi:outer membrane protein, heavy metal efflux system